MSQISRAILGGAAAALTLSAIQFAFGSDLRGTVAEETATVVAAPIGSLSHVNRAAKADRATLVTAQAVAGKTLLFSVQGLADTSVLMRMPAAQVKVEAFKTVASPDKPVSLSQKSALACEPPVSMLTEVARLLQPGRCVT